jgi:hypothetical protein
MPVCVRYRIAVLAVLAAVTLRGQASAQSDTASLTVVVADPSGAVVPGAMVSLRNVEAGAGREGSTDATGRATFAVLAAGTYETTVDLSGFKSYHDPSFHLQVGQSATLNVVLDVGPTTEGVEVRAAVRLIDLDTAAQSTVITEERVQALPLNGRQFIQLALLAPGANPGGRAVQQNQTGRLNQIGGLSIGGGRTNNTFFSIDGALDTDPDYNSLNYSPGIDAISEFQVQASQFAAEYGRAGAQVNLVTKSGAASLHGSAFEFDRNKRFDSKPFNLVGDLPRFQRDDFGGTLGGPIAPGRLFFFLSYEQLRRREGASNLTTVTVPTALERQGDFSQSGGGGIFDPATGTSSRTSFQNNTILMGRIDPWALAALQALPLPNTGINGYVNNQEITQQDTHNYSLRLNVNLGPRHQVFSRVSVAQEDAVIPDVVPGRSSVSNGQPINAVAAWTSILGSREVNEARIGFSQLSLVSGLPELSFSVNGAPTTLPRFIISGYPAMGGAGAFTGTNGGGIVRVKNPVFQAYDNLSWQRGLHQFKAGAEFIWTNYNRTEVPSTLGTFTYVAGYTSRTASNDGTGNALASLLLGLPQIGTRAVGPSTIAGRQPQFSTFFQDNWRVSDSLTVNLGLRYELAPPMYDANGQMATIDYSQVPSPQQIFAQGRLASYMPTVVVCGQNGFPKGCADTDKDNLAPRVGFSWHAAEHLVVRGGAGIYYLPQDGNPLFRLAAGIPANIAQTITLPAFVPVHSPGYDIFGPAVLGPVQIQQAGIDRHQETGRSTQWTIGVQREIGGDWVVEAAYVGSHAVNLEQNVQPNNAQPGQGTVDPRRPYAGLVFAPNTTFPGYVTVQGSSVPVGQINYFPHSARADYNALELRVERRFAAGLSMLSAYTLSDARTNAPQFRNAGGVNGSENSPPQNSYDLEAEWGPAYYNARHRWVTNLIWTPPFGAGKRYANQGIPAAIFGAWQLAGIWTMQSGFPFTVNLQGDTAGVGGGSGGIFVRPNVVPGVDPYLPSSDWARGLYLNPAAFSLPPAGTFGNASRNSLVGPGYTDLDLAIARIVPLPRSRQLELRVEAFNLLNRTNYNLVGRILNAPNFGQLQSQYDPRQWQFGIRFAF